MASECSACKSVRGSEYHAKKMLDSDYHRWYNRRSAARRKCNPEQHVAYAAAYRKAHPEECAARDAAYYAAHREEKAAYAAAWRKAHLEECAARSRTRQARKQNAPGSHIAADVAAQRTRQRGKCFYCGKKVGRHYHVDHVIPLALGGSNGPENLVIACPDCNQRKHAKHPMDFAGILF